MPTRKTTRIPPRTRPPRRRLPSPLARPSHERVQFSESFFPSLQQKAFSPGCFSQWRYPSRQKVPHGFPVFGYCTTTYLFLLIRPFFFIPSSSGSCLKLLPLSHHCTARALSIVVGVSVHVNLHAGLALCLLPFRASQIYSACALWTGKEVEGFEEAEGGSHGI